MARNKARAQPAAQAEVGKELVARSLARVLATGEEAQIAVALPMVRRLDRMDGERLCAFRRRGLG
jgi:hypothetical protein